MEHLTIARFMTMIRGDILQSGADMAGREISGISTDSRRVAPGDVFFAISGPRFDGADYADAAHDAGAMLSVVNASSVRGRTFGSPVVTVTDTVTALGEFAAAYRRGFDIPVVAVTGTSGKTTAKEMMLAVLGTKYRVHGTAGNFNNHIGVPLSIAGLERRHECAVFELGMSAPGEIRSLARMAAPDVGVVLNAGPGHTAFFPDIEAIAAAKLELAEEVAPGGTVVLNGDDRLLMAGRPRVRAKVVTFGRSAGCDVRPAWVTMGADGCATFGIGGHEVRLAIPGAHTVMNALAAYAVGTILGVGAGAAVAALATVAAPERRMQVIHAGGTVWIDDTYNANPLSMRAAAEALGGMPGALKGAVLGDMRELGALTESAHRDIGRLFGGMSLEWLALVGEYAELYAGGAREAGMDPGRIVTFADADEARRFVTTGFRGFDAVLVKGSRAVGLERLVNAVKENV